MRNKGMELLVVLVLGYLILLSNKIGFCQDRLDQLGNSYKKKPALFSDCLKPYIKKREENWVLGNAYIEFSVSQKSGDIKSFIIKEKSVDILNFPADISINNHPLGAVKESSIKEAGKDNGVTLLMCRPVKGLPFDAWINYRISNVSIKWKVDVLIPPGNQKGEYFITYNFPSLNKKMKGFVPSVGAPFDVTKGMEHFGYRKRFHWAPASGHTANVRWPISLPLACFYDSDNDFGITFTVEPFDSFYQPVSFDFFYENQEKSFTVKISPEKKGNAISAEISLFPHKGDYRPGLGWVYQRFPQMFEPVDKSVLRLIGTSQCGGSRLDKDIKELVLKGGLVWRAINTDGLGHALGRGRYGIWIPDNPKDYPKTVSEIASIRKEIETLHKYGVKALLYCQAIDCSDIEYAKEHFFEAIRKRNDGSLIVSGYGVTMDPRNKKWTAHIVEQVRRLLKTFPEADGIFWDLSAFSGQYELMSRISNLVRAQGKLLFGNGTVLNQGRFLDVCLSEGSREGVETRQYAFLNKPHFFLPVYYDELSFDGLNAVKATSRPENVEKDLKTIFKCGAFYEFQWKFAFGSESCEVLNEYLRLSRYLAGRKWVFNAHALQLPPEIEGNIFKNVDGNYVIPLIVDNISYFDKSGLLIDIPMMIRVPDAEHIKAAYIMSVDQQGLIKLPLDREGQEIKLTIPEIKSASLVLLAKNGFYVSMDGSSQAVAGKTGYILLSIDNFEDKERDLKLSIETPSQIYHKDLIIESGNTETIKIPIDLTKTREGDVYPIKIVSKSGREEDLHFQIDYPIRDAFFCTMDTKLLRRGTKNDLHITVGNISGEYISSCTLELVLPPEWKMLSDNLVKISNLRNREYKVIPFSFIPVIGEDIRRTSISCRIRRNGKIYDKSFNVDVRSSAAKAKCVKASSEIIIDGRNDEWQQAEGIKLNQKSQVRMKGWGGPDDLSGTLYTMWDDNNIYIYAAIKDDEFCHPYQGFGIWAGDAIQIGFATPIGHAECGFALNAQNDPEIFFWAPEEKVVIPRDGKLAVVRKDDYTYYEAALSLNILPFAGKIKDGDTIRFSFTLNDADTKGKKPTKEIIQDNKLFRGWMEWTPGICGGKDISKYGTLIFTE